MALFSRGNLLYHLYRQGEWDEALQGAESLIDEAVAAGLHSVERLAPITRTLVRLGRADAAGADADSARLLELGRTAGDPQAIIPALMNRVIALTDTGRVDEAQALAEELQSTASGARLA
jgi:hypothetical protein